MSITKTATAYFASGEIKFSTLRDTFKGSGTEIKASELFRDTDTNQPSPVVPDATENDSIAGNNYGTSFNGTNLSLLGFRNSIKEYTFTQSGTDTKLDIIDELTWNSNLPKNIKKKFIVNGTIGSDDPSVPAASVDAEIRNLTIGIGTAGKIHGASGAGGVYGTNSGKGGDGGTALYAESTATDELTKSITINLTSSSQLFGGGGGGGAGPTGGTGGTGASVHNLAGGAGGPGGNGGNGGVGQGYNNAATLGLTGAGGAIGSDGNSKEWQKTNGSTMSTETFISGKGGTGGKGGDGGDGGNFGKNGSNGSSTGQLVGEEGESTDTLEYYRVPRNENFTSGMLVGYKELNLTNFNQHPVIDGNTVDICTAYYNASDPVTDSNGKTIGYKQLNFYDNNYNTNENPSCILRIEGPTGGVTVASNPRFTLDGYGLVADSSGKIRLSCGWADTSQDGISIQNIYITGSTGTVLDDSEDNSTFEYNTNLVFQFDYEPVVTNGNVVVFGTYRDADHENYITFGGKYDSSLSVNEPKFIDPAGGLPTFGPGTNSSNSVDIIHVNMPAGTIHGPIWGRDSANANGFHKGIDIKENATSSIEEWGACMNDSGGDDDFNDLIVIPTDQRTAGTDLTSGSILPPEPPALPTDMGTGGGAGRSVVGLNQNYNLSGSINSDTIKGEYL
tara:strand:+ start:23 stop:2044 length:2022 start_codon:yes stop_codon:yes gene_type:complete